MMPRALTLLLLFLSIETQAQVVELVSDIFAGTNSSYPQNLVEFNGKLYFVANTPATGAELWSFDNNQVQVVHDIHTGIYSSSPGQLKVVSYLGEEYLSFRASEPSTGSEIYLLDSSENLSLIEFEPGGVSSPVRDYCFWNDQLILSYDDGLSGHELWKYDGTQLELVEDIRPGQYPSVPNSFVEFQGNLLFYASEPFYGNELYQTDGDSAWLVQDLFLGPPPSVMSQTIEYHIFNDELFYAARDTFHHGFELWKYDGTNVSLTQEISITDNANPSFMEEYEGQLFFQAYDDPETGKELWSYDGVECNLVEDLLPGSSDGAPANLLAIGQTLLFTANTAFYGNELWSMFQGVIKPQYDVNPGVNGSSPRELVTFNGDVFFSAQVDSVGRELFRIRSFTGIEDHSNEESLSVYPNPASAEIHLKSDVPLGDIRIFDIFGKLVYVASSTESSFTISKHNLKKGLYMITTEGAAGSNAKKLLFHP